MPPKVYTDMSDVYYDLFLDLGLGLKNGSNLLYDQDTESMLQYKEKYIKGSIDGSPIYVGRNEVAFEPMKNYGLMITLFGYGLDKATKSEDGDLIGGYVANFLDDNEDRTKQRVVVRSKTYGDIASQFYFNVYLGYIELLFKIFEGIDTQVDLSKFDIIEVG